METGGGAAAATDPGGEGEGSVGGSSLPGSEPGGEEVRLGEGPLTNVSLLIVFPTKADAVLKYLENLSIMAVIQ